MKAIQITYIPATNKRDTWLKAWTEAGHISEPISYDIDADKQAKRLARRYARELGWEVRISGFGTLPNGDWVATLGAK